MHENDLATRLERDLSNSIAQQPLPLTSVDSDDDDGDDAESVFSSETSAEVQEVGNPEAFKRQANRSAFFKHLKDDEGEVGGLSGISISPAKTQFVLATDRIIDSVRDYQQELFERAKEENIVAV